jgi:hypothetical protein
MTSRMLRWLRWSVGSCLFFVLVERTLWAQCAMCRTGLLNSPEGQMWARGFAQGILFLLAVPFVIIGSLAALIWNAHRRSTGLPRGRQVRAEAPSQRVTPSLASG